MITPSNLKDVLESLKEQDVIAAMESPKDYLSIQLHTFNVGSYASITAVDYDEDVEQEHSDNGDMFLSKDSFVDLLVEVGPCRVYLLELV